MNRGTPIRTGVSSPVAQLDRVSGIRRQSMYGQRKFDCGPVENGARLIMKAKERFDLAGDQGLATPKLLKELDSSDAS
ncbi:MAG: hypothetical protein SFZ23_11455 [Planctomycetota bacterium]|nr:hypothetical protein [Planctomycetota bacterium]